MKMTIVMMMISQHDHDEDKDDTNGDFGFATVRKKGNKYDKDG